MILSLILAMHIQMTTQDTFKPVQPNLLASASREELVIIDRLHSLRQAVEKLPDDWKATGLKRLAPGAVINKEGLLHEIEDMELTAAERWRIIIENASVADRPDGRSAQDYRKELGDLPRLHAEMNQRLDEFNSKLKDGILVNMASKFLAN